MLLAVGIRLAAVPCLLLYHMSLAVQQSSGQHMKLLLQQTQQQQQEQERQHQCCSHVVHTMGQF